MTLYEKIDWEFVQELKDASIGNEGAILNNPDPVGVKEQVDFIESVLPKFGRILEIGTNKATFCYLCMLHSDKLIVDTIDIAQWCSKPVEILNKKFGNRVNLMIGESSRWFSKLNEFYQLAFVDGNHSYKETLNDLIECEGYGIHEIMVDDFRNLVNVREAVLSFIGSFSITAVTDKIDTRGMVYLKNLEV